MPVMERKIQFHCCTVYRRSWFSIFFLLCIQIGNSWAGVTPAGTRIIMLEGQRQSPLMLANKNFYPVVAQLWVDDGNLNNKPNTVRSPYMVLPPIFHMRAGSIQSVRLLSTGQEQPLDRESLYWLNIYEIPPSGDGTKKADEIAKMTITLRTQMKVIHRPKALIALAETAAEKVQFSLEHNQLRVSNPTAYYITLSSIKLRHPNGESLKQVDMLAPFSQAHVDLQGISQVDQIDFTWLDDDGNGRDRHAVLSTPLLNTP